MSGWSRREVIVAGGAAGVLLPVTESKATPPNKPDDASIAVRLLSRYHPGLLRYQDGRAWANSVDRFARDWRGTSSLDDQFLLLSALTASIRCGHTHCNPYNQADTVGRLMAEKHLLPFHFDWLGRRMIVTSDPHGIGVQRGVEIVSIDGSPAQDLIARLLPLTRADGALDNKRRALLSVTGAKYETLDLLTGAMGIFGETVALTLRGPDGSIDEREVATIAFDQRATADVAGEKESGAPLWSLRTEVDVAIMTMPTWAVFNSDWDWASWLDGAFASLRDVGKLVVDLRGNEGGLDACGAALMAHLIDRPITIPRSRSLTRISTVAKEDRPYLDTWDESFFTIGETFAVAGPGYRVVPGDEDIVISPTRSGFGGKTVILVDASNSSATGIFAEAVKRAGIATLVGQETGRNQRGGNGGAFFFARLPESGLEFDIPLVGGFAPGDPPDAGTMPDIAVERTPESIASGGDPELSVALAYLA